MQAPIDHHKNAARTVSTFRALFTYHFHTQCEEAIAAQCPHYLPMSCDRSISTGSLRIGNDSATLLLTREPLITVKLFYLCDRTKAPQGYRFCESVVQAELNRAAQPINCIEVPAIREDLHPPHWHCCTHGGYHIIAQCKFPIEIDSALPIQNVDTFPDGRRYRPFGALEILIYGPDEDPTSPHSLLGRYNRGEFSLPTTQK